MEQRKVGDYMTPREKIMSNPQWKATLMGFERNIGEVDIDKYGKYYSIYQKNKEHEYDNLLTTLEMTSIESVVLFMQGALFIECQNGKNKLRKEDFDAGHSN